jgi:hypothetical protein
MGWGMGVQRSTICLSSRLALARTRIVTVCTPDTGLYAVVGGVVGSLLVGGHAASVRAVTGVMWALLLSQSLHVADLARALPDLSAMGARQGMRRVRRVLGRSTLSGEVLGPLLLGCTLRLVREREITLVLDSTRCLCWEVFTLGVVYWGRVLPVGWSILPYPWPKHRFTPTVINLVERVLPHWPTERPIRLLADRGFPSLKLFRCLEEWQKRLTLGYTIRLRAGDWVRLEDGTVVKLKQLIREWELGTWRSWRAGYRHRGKVGPLALLVVGQSQPVYPLHQQGPADTARRLARKQRRQSRLLSKGQPNASTTDGVWALLSTAGSCEAARQAYAWRFHTEGTYRDLKTWGLEQVAAHETDLVHLDGLMGLACLTYFIQTAIGAMAGCASSPQAQARQHQWCTTDRLSIFWRGRQVLHDRAHDWRPWLHSTIPTLAHDLARPTTIPTHQSQEAA